MRRNVLTLGLATCLQALQVCFAATWTDDPLVANATPIRVVHVTELRNAINAARAAAGLSAYAWTDPSLVAGSSVIRTVHVTEMRAAIAEVYSSLGQSVPTWADAVLTPNVTPIRATDIMELRNAVQNAPTKPPPPPPSDPGGGRCDCWGTSSGCLSDAGYGCSVWGSATQTVASGSSTNPNQPSSNTWTPHCPLGRQLQVTQAGVYVTPRQCDPWHSNICSGYYYVFSCVLQ